MLWQRPQWIWSLSGSKLYLPRLHSPSLHPKHRRVYRLSLQQDHLLSPNCKNGECIGDGCTSEDDDCESVEADICTETVYSSMVTPASTYTTKTSTRCKTITACDAEASTTTTTISSESAYVIVTMAPYPGYTVMDDAEATTFQKSMEEMFESIWATDTDTTSTSSTIATTSTGSPTTSTSVSHGTPTATSVDATPTTFHSPSNKTHIEMNFYKDSSCGDFIAGYEWDYDLWFSYGGCPSWGIEQIDGVNMVASSVYPVFSESDWNLGIQSLCIAYKLGQQLKTRICDKLDYNPDGDDSNARGTWIIFSKDVPYGS